MRTSAISKGISKHLPEKLADCTLWTRNLCLGCAECLSSVLESTGRALPRVLQPKRNVSLNYINYKTTTMYQHSTPCFRKHRRHRLLVTAPSIHENNLMLTSVRRETREDRNRRNSILWEGLLYLSLKLSMWVKLFVREAQRYVSTWWSDVELDMDKRSNLCVRALTWLLWELVHPLFLFFGLSVTLMFI